MESEIVIMKTIPVSYKCVPPVRIKSSAVGGVWGGNNRENLIWCLYNVLCSYISLKSNSASYLTIWRLTITLVAIPHR